MQAEHGGRPVPLRLDTDGAERQQAWEACVKADDQNRVAALVDDVRWQRNWKTDWAANQDPFQRTDWIVRIRSDLAVVIREFSDENPQDMFGLWIVDDRRAEDTGA